MLIITCDVHDCKEQIACDITSTLTLIETPWKFVSELDILLTGEVSPSAKSVAQKTGHYICPSHMEVYRTFFLNKTIPDSWKNK